jgi:uroporphyrinogen-III synthase
LNFLLVRVEGAPLGLPERLRSLGAGVSEVAGYRMLVEASAKTAEKVFGRKLRVLVLANPTAVRFLVRATDELGIDLQVRLKGVSIAAVGPATAEAARSHGLTPDIVSKGHIADLAESLTDFF